MDGKVTHVTIGAKLSIDDSDAEVLEHVSSYGIGTIFNQHCSKAIDAERIDAVLARLRTACAKITKAKRDALRALDPTTC